MVEPARERYAKILGSVLTAGRVDIGAFLNYAKRRKLNTMRVVEQRKIIRTKVGGEGGERIKKSGYAVHSTIYHMLCLATYNHFAWHGTTIYGQSFTAAFSIGNIILLRQFTKSPLFALCQRGKLLSPSLEKRGEGRFSDQTAQSIRLASRHKRYLSE